MVSHSKHCLVSKHIIKRYLYSCNIFLCAGVPSRLESKKYETLKHELDEMKKKLNAMSADNNRLKSNLSQFDAKDKQQRNEIDRLSQHMAESSEKLRSANKEKVMKKNKV